MSFSRICKDLFVLEIYPIVIESARYTSYKPQQKHFLYNLVYEETCLISTIPVINCLIKTTKKFSEVLQHKNHSKKFSDNCHKDSIDFLQIVFFKNQNTVPKNDLIDWKLVNSDLYFPLHELQFSKQRLWKSLAVIEMEITVKGNIFIESSLNRLALEQCVTKYILSKN